MRHFALPLVMTVVGILPGCWSEGRAERAAEANRSSWDVGPTGLLTDDPSTLEIEDDPVSALRDVAVQMNNDSLRVVTPRASVELAAFFPSGAQLVGVALDGRQGGAPPYVLEAYTGLYRVTDGEAELVFDLRASRVLGSTGDGSPPPALTDIAFDRARTDASGKLTFAVTAENDGFALELPGSTLQSYFCYLPPSGPAASAEPSTSISQELREQGVPVIERTDAVAINELDLQIAAQPRTLRLDDGSVAGSELFAFDAAGGTPIGTWRLDRTSFVAGGAAFFAQALTLGAGPDLYFTGGWGQDVYRQLYLKGLKEITGLAARTEDTLLVLDGPSKRLYEVGLQQVVDALNGN